MSLFIYEAIREPGNSERGEIQADSAQAAASILLAKGYHVLRVEDSESSGFSRRSLCFGWRTGLRRNELTRLTRDLASLLRAGLTLSASLGTLQVRFEKHAWRRIAAGLLADLEEGRTFAEALSQYPQIFEPMYLGLVRAGEESGRLVESLVRLAEVGEKRDELIARVKMAMLYPTVMISLGVATVVVLLTFVVPMFTGVFKDTGQQLPWPTQALVMISHGLQIWWPVILPGCALTLFVLMRFLKTDRGKHIRSALVLHLPVLSGIVCKSQVADFARTLATLLASGVPIVHGLSITAATLTNVYYREAAARLGTALREGARLSQAIETAPPFPQMLTSVIAVGEESGTLAESLDHVAIEYEKEIDREVKTAMALLEPLMIILMGGMVGFIVVAMLLPIFSLGDVVNVE